MGKSHLFYIRNKSFSYFIIAIIAFFIMFNGTLPTSQVNFIYRPGSIKCIVLFSFFHPGYILPFIIEVPGNACCIGSFLPEIRKGISLVYFSFCITDDM